MTLHGLGSAEAANGVTGTTFKRASTNDDVVTTPVLDGARAFKVDPVGGLATPLTYGWNVVVDAEGNHRLMLASAIIRIDDFWDESVALMELGQGIILGNPVRQVSISAAEKLSISDKDEDEVGSTSTGYLAVDIDYFFLWLYDQRSLTNTLDVLWVRKPAASIGPATTIAFNDANPDTITDSGNGFGVFTAGMIITVSGSTSNDGTYTIASVTAGTITLVDGDTLTTESAGANVTVAHSEQWYKAINVTGHGDGVDSITALTLGTHTGKGPLPTTGGPFYFVNAVLQNLEKSPNGGSAEPKDDAKGSFACKVKMASANGVDGDFDAGTGTNPDWNDVKEIPSDDATSYDEGNVVNDRQSYAIANAGGGEGVLAAQVVGAIRQTGLQDDLTARPFIYDGTLRQNLPTVNPGGGWNRLNNADVDVTLNRINGVDLSESLFNDLEAGLEITQVQNAKVIQVSQIGLEYAIVGSKPLPSDFPNLRVPRGAGVALGSGNLMMI